MSIFTPSLDISLDNEMFLSGGLQGDTISLTDKIADELNSNTQVPSPATPTIQMQLKLKDLQMYPTLNGNKDFFKLSSFSKEISFDDCNGSNIIIDESNSNIDLHENVTVDQCLPNSRVQYDEPTVESVECNQCEIVDCLPIDNLSAEDYDEISESDDTLPFQTFIDMGSF